MPTNPSAYVYLGSIYLALTEEHTLMSPQDLVRPSVMLAVLVVIHQPVFSQQAP